MERESTLIVGDGSTLLQNLALSDISEGRSVLYVSENASTVLKRIPKTEQKRTTYIAPYEKPFASNFLAHIPRKRHALTASVYAQAIIGQSNFEKLDPVVLRKYLRRTLQTLLAVSDTSLLSVYFLLSSPEYRARIVSKVSDTILKTLWDDFETLTPKEKRDEVRTTLTRAEAVLLDPVLRASLDQADNKIELAGNVTIVSLHDFEMGTDNAALYGLLVLAHAYLTALEGHELSVYIEGTERFGREFLEKLQEVCLVVGTAKRITHTFPRMFAFRTIEDEERLQRHLHVLDSEIPVSELPDGAFYARLGDRAVQVLEYPLRFPQTREAKKIKARSALRTQPPETLEERLGRFL